MLHPRPHLLLSATAGPASHSVDVKMQQELVRFKRCSETLQELIEDFTSADSRPEAIGRRAVILAQIADLKNILADEVKTRETTDDKVVEAINQYTSTLQRSLQRAHNSTLATSYEMSM